MEKNIQLWRAKKTNRWRQKEIIIGMKEKQCIHNFSEYKIRLKGKHIK